MPELLMAFDAVLNTVAGFPIVRFKMQEASMRLLIA